MSKVISAMLDQPEHIVRRVINKLEDKNGYPSHDVRLIAKNMQQVRTKITEFGLDPNDTTAQELYHTLLAKFEADSAKFDEQHQPAANTCDARMALAIKLVSKNIDLAQRWSLKIAAAKNLLRQNPPKQIMKHLNYRSLDSMVKREDLPEIYLAAGYFESHGWQKAQQKLVSQLDSTAFEMRPIRLVALTSEKWGYFEPDGFFAYDAENASLALLPTEQLNRAPLLTMAVLLLDGLSNIEDINISAEAARLSPAAAWWHDMDGLMASLGNSSVSFNLKDCALNHLDSQPFESRQLGASRRSFWHELINSYENQLPAEEDVQAFFNDSLKTLKTPINQPAFEYAEDI